MQPRAYVESFKNNAVDTGYYANKDTKFIADFEFVNANAGVVFGSNYNGNKNVGAFYINGSKRFSWTVNGLWAWTIWYPGGSYLTPVANKRIVATVNGTDATASIVYLADGATYTSAITGKTLVTADATASTWLFQWVNFENNATYVKMHSFEADDDCASGVPAVFFAPTVDTDGNAGFTNIVAGTFHGELNPDATTPLAFSAGIGDANDYKYEDGTFSAKFYAYSADTDMGGVKFGDGEASGEASVWIARGGSVTLTAVPAEGLAFAGWTGDTWAIVSGNENDASVTVANDRAAQLLATFTSAPALTLADGASAVWGEAAWQAGGAAASAPASGDAVVVLSGDATVALDGDVSLDSLRILGTGTLTIARGTHAYSVASTITASGTDYLVTLADGKIVFDYDDEGKIAELRMTPDPGETLTLDDGKLDFAAGARIVPGQGGDEGGRSVIVGGFTAAGGLEIAGVTNMTWTGASLLDTTTPSMLFYKNTRLDEIVPLRCYGTIGGTTVELTDNYLYTPYHIVRDGNVVRFEVQLWDGTHTKAMFMELTQSGDDIYGKQLAQGLGRKKNVLGTRMFSYSNGKVTLASGLESYQKYKLMALVVGPRSGGRSKLTFSVDGAQALPALSGGGVEVTFDANGRGESTDFFKSDNLARNDNWQTLTTEYSLSEIVLRSGYLQGSYCGEVPVIAFGWTNDNTTAGCQLQHLGSSYLRGVDIVLRQGDGKVEIKRVKALYINKSHAKNGIDYTTIYGNRYLLESDTSYKSSNLTADRQSPLWVSTQHPLATVTASGANTMDDSAYVVKGDVAHPIEFDAAHVNALPDETTDCYGNASLRLTKGGTYTAGIQGAKIIMHPGTTLYSQAEWTFHQTTQTVVIDGATLNLDDNYKYINSLVLTNGAVVTRGDNTRLGYNANPTWSIAGEGVSTCASDANILASNSGAKRSWTIDVADTVAGEASDFIMYGDIAHDSKYLNGALVKSGPGTMEMQGTIVASNNAVHVTAGTLLLGKTGAAAPEVSFSLEGGTLALAAGTAHEATTLYVQQADSTLALGEGATLEIANLSISDGKTLTLSGDVGKESLKVSEPLDASTLNRIMFADDSPGATVQTAEGYIRKSKGFIMIIK